MLQIFPIVHNYTLKKLNSQAYVTKTYHEGKPLPFGTFVLKPNFTHVHFSDKLKPLRYGPYKIWDRLSDVTYELISPDCSTFHIHRNHLIPYHPNKPLLYPHLRNFMRFSDSFTTDIPKPIKYANSVLRAQLFTNKTRLKSFIFQALWPNGYNIGLLI